MKGRSALPRGVFLFVLLAVAAAMAAAAWGRDLLGTIGYFNVRRVEVVGAQWVAPDSLFGLAGITRDQSVWEDHGAARQRLLEHPLIDQAEIRRLGLRGLRIVVREVQPLALVSSPQLRAVRGDGRLLPIELVGSSIDLPLLTVEARLSQDSTRLADGVAMEALRIFSTLHGLDPGLSAIVSDFALVGDRDFMMNLVTSQPVERIAVPAEIDERLVRRVRATLSDLRRRRIEATEIEARYADQIVVRRGPV